MKSPTSYFLIFFTLISMNSFAQQPVKEKGVQPNKPLYKGSMNEYVIDSLKLAMNYADSLDISGTVMISFVVEKDGSVSNVEVIKGIDPVLDSTAKSVVENMPKWEPARHNGKPVRVKQMLPIRFDMSDRRNSNMKDEK